MVSRRSVRIKSTSVLKKLKKRIGSKPKSSVAVQDVNLKQPAANSQIDTAREYTRMRRSSISENKQKEYKSSINVANQEDSRIKSCTVLAVKLKYPYVGRTTSVKLNNKSPNKNSDSSKALPRTTAKSPEPDLDEQGASRKSSRMRKPTNKELRSVLISTDTKLGLKKHNGEVSPQKLPNKSVKPQITNETSIPDQKVQAGKVSPSEKKVKDDMECVKCGITPAQFFSRDTKHNTVCCFCSLVKPPQELTALLQLLKLDCCLKFLNQTNQNSMERSISPSRKRKMSEHTSISNSDVKTLKEKNTLKTQKEQHNQNSPAEPKQNTRQFSRPTRQQKGNSSIKLNKPSNSAKSPAAVSSSSTRISARVTGKTAFPRIKPPTKSKQPKLSTIKDIHRNLKRKISPQATQNPTKRRKLTENVEVQKKSDKEHVCSSCNSTFAMQWKLKLHELTHADKRYPNVVLRHTEVKDASNVTNVEGEGFEAMVCDPNNENATDKDSLNVHITDLAVQQINTTAEELQGNKITSDNLNSKQGGDDLEHSQDFKQRNEVESALEDNEESANKHGSNDTQHTEIIEANIFDGPANRENAEVNQKSNGLDSYDVQTNYDNPLDKDNVEVNEESDEPTKCDEVPISNDSTYQSTKTRDNKISEKSDLSSVHDVNSVRTEEHLKDTEQSEINLPNETASSKGGEPKEKEYVMQKIDAVSDEDTALGESEVENTLKGLNEVRQENENNEESEESIKAIEETETYELSKTNEDDLADEENEENSNEICGDTAGEKTEMNEDDAVEESSKINENCCKETVSLKNSSDHCEQKDESLVTEKESDSEDTANECSCEVGKIETELKDKHDDPHNVDVSENNEKKVNGTVTDNNDENNDGSKNTFELENASHQEIAINHAPDNTSEHPVDENMSELYNQMNIIFEGEPDANKAAKTETEKKSPDYHGNGDNSSNENAIQS